MTLPNTGLPEASLTTNEHLIFNQFGLLADVLNKPVPNTRVNISAPPANPTKGVVVLITGDTPATGVFSGKEGNAAIFSVSSWIFLGDSLHWEGEEGKWGYDSTLLEWVNRVGGGSALGIEEEAISVDAAVTKINFTGGVTVTPIISGEVEVNIPGGAGSDLEISDENSLLSTATTAISFTGAGVTASSPSAGEIVVDIPGGVGSDLEVRDETTVLGTAVERIDFIGSGVNATSPSPGVVEVNISSGIDGIDGVDGVAVGFQLTHTTGTVNTNGEIGGSTIISWHKNDRNGVLLPLLSEGDYWFIQDETNSANYAYVLLGAVTFTDPIYSAPATRTDGGAIGDAVNVRAFPLIRGLPGVGGGSALEIEDEGDSIDTAVSKINFTGSGVIVSPIVSGEVEVTIPGGGTSVTLDIEVEDYFTDYGTLASQDQILATNKMVVDLKREGLWPKIELLYVNFGDSIANVLVPLKGTGNATADRTIVTGDIATSKGGGLEPTTSVFLQFPQLSSTTNYHFGWAKKPTNVTTGFVTIVYSLLGQGFTLAISDTSSTLWSASGVAPHPDPAAVIRSWMIGGFVGTATGNTNKFSINPYGQLFSSTTTSVTVTTPALVYIGLLGPRQPAFCAGGALTAGELAVLQGILDTFARNV